MKKLKIVIATIKSWNIKNAEKMVMSNLQHEIKVVSKKEDLNICFLDDFKPDFVFFPHWSWIIPKEVYEKFNCIVFHMTDLPFGRGGSPLQNLISRGIYNTKISAIKVGDGIDTGDVYLKKDIDISSGNADEIFCRVSQIVFDKMIPVFFCEKLVCKPQVGEIVQFKRRTPNESEMPLNLSKTQMYDFIRMLDGEGYPKAFIKTENGKAVFFNAVLKDNKLEASVEFKQEDV